VTIIELQQMTALGWVVYLSPTDFYIVSQ